MEGYPKLIDFGTSKKLSGKTYTVVGTPHYMAPEVIIGRGYSMNADLYSLGVMLYEFVCGATPFGNEEEDPFRIYEMVLDHKLVYPRYVNIGNKTRAAIDQMLNKNPAFRGTVESIKGAPWFSGIDWNELLIKQASPPYVP